MTWQDRMYGGVGQHLRTLGLDATKVLSVYEDIYVYSNFDIEKTLDIKYLDSAGAERTFGYEGTFYDFIQGIT